MDCNTHWREGQKWTVDAGQRSTVTLEPASGLPATSRTVTWSTKSARGQTMRHASTEEVVGSGTGKPAVAGGTKERRSSSDGSTGRRFMGTSDARRWGWKPKSWLRRLGTSTSMVPRDRPPRSQYF